MGQNWDYAHDVEDNLASVTDPLNLPTTHGYDPLNRLISTIDRESYGAGMKYNPADQLTEYTDLRNTSNGREKSLMTIGFPPPSLAQCRTNPGRM